jgi:predicted ABC-type ATPase
MGMSSIYIIAGPNGAGKTTASYTVLPEMLDCNEFVNADEIARGLSPFQPDKAAIDAGRIMLNRIRDLIRLKIDFAFETTLSTKSYVKTIQSAKENGFTVTLVFFWLNSVNLAKERVRARVAEGGHNIPEDVILRRYKSGIKNFLHLYLPIIDNWMVIDNSQTPFQLVAEGNEDKEIQIYNSSIWNQINQISNGK